MPITALPAPPQRNDPATFADRGDALLGALPGFVTEANALETNVNAKESSAVAAAATAVASAAVAQPAANFKGNWSALTGALNMPASVVHVNVFWALNTNLANVTTATPGVSASWTRIGAVGTSYTTYDNRADLRALTPAAGDQAVIEGLGYFVWQTGITEIDDDESCFSTASGQWLLQAASWELVDAWAVADRFDEFAFDARLDSTVDTAVATSFAAKVLSGSATCAIATLATVTSTSFTGTVTGAAIGNRVIATPPAQLGTDAASTGRLSYHAWVSSANTVTIMLTNASAATATINAAVQAAWPITVIKP